MTENRAELVPLIRAWRAGQPGALAQLMPRVYRSLRRLAHAHLRRERHRTTLHTTAVVEETYLRLADLRGISWKDRAHFYAMAARIMRRVLVEDVHRHNPLPGAPAHECLRVDTLNVAPLRSEISTVQERLPALLDLDRALSALTERDQRQVEIAEMHVFGGLSRAQIAEVLGQSNAAVAADWQRARVWLLDFLESHETGDPS